MLRNLLLPLAALIATTAAHAEVLDFPAPTSSPAPVVNTNNVQALEQPRLSSPNMPAPVPNRVITEEPLPVATPTRGLKMAQVRKRFGEPKLVTGPIGDPPITRWDYTGFRVFFEDQTVLHSVIPNTPPKVHHTDELTRISE